jgi:hypothetical protein
MASQSLESVITTYREPLSKLGMTFLGPLGGFGKSLILLACWRVTVLAGRTKSTGWNSGAMPTDRPQNRA